MSPLSRALEISQPHRLTLRAVLQMQEAGILDGDAQVELIDGVLVQKPGEGLTHQIMKARITKALLRRPGDDVQVIIGGTLTLSPIDALDPDFFLYDAAIPLTAVDAGKVGLVIEVAETSLDRDLSLKAELYARFGVRDYWVVDTKTETLVVHRDPVDSAYREVSRHAASYAVDAIALTSVSLRLSDLPPLR